jgi:hypothetical protein
MVDAVHKRFNIDLHLEVGTSRHFARGVAVVQPYTSAPLQPVSRGSLDCRHFLDVARCDARRQVGIMLPMQESVSIRRVSVGTVRPAYWGRLALANATPSPIPPARASPVRTTKRR